MKSANRILRVGDRRQNLHGTIDSGPAKALSLAGHQLEVDEMNHGDH